MRRASQSQTNRGKANDSQYQFKWQALLVLLVLSAAEALAQEKRRAAGNGAGELEHFATLEPLCTRAAEKPAAATAVSSPPAAPAAPAAKVRRIVVSLPDRKLALIEDGQVVKTYDVAVGADATPSPAGAFRVTHRIPDPTWYASGKVVGPGKANPLGTRWIGLSGDRGFGIHGTNAPRSIGKAASHGCIRMRNRDVEELFALVKSGDAVELHSVRNEVVAAIFGAPALPPALPIGPMPQPRVVSQGEVANGGL